MAGASLWGLPAALFVSKYFLSFLNDFSCIFIYIIIHIVTMIVISTIAIVIDIVSVIII